MNMRGIMLWGVGHWLGVALMFSALSVRAYDFRIAGGRLWNVSMAVGWTNVAGEVITVHSTGIVAQVVTHREVWAPRESSYLESTGQLGGGRAFPGRLLRVETTRGKKFFVAHAPHSAAEGQEIKWRVLPVGRIMVGDAVLEAYDYGRAATRDEVLEEFERRTVGEPADPEQGARVLEYQHQQATNGLPSFQYQLGLRYLKGDGVESNLTVAIHWLRSATTNGHSQARALLGQVAP